MKNILYTITLLLAMTACEDPFFDDDPSNDPITNFDIMWNTMNDKYVYFDYKNIDWDSIRAVYRPQVSLQMTDLDLYQLMENMLNTLRDGHVNLRSEFDISFYDGFYKNYPENFDFQLLEKHYLGNYKITGSLINSIIDSIGYIHYNSFNGLIRNEDLDFIVQRFNGLKGVIIDIRNNEGGDPANGFKFAERITDQRRHIYTTKYKSGPGKNDFTEPDMAFIEPAGKYRFHQPIVLLTNRKTYSAGNFFTATLKAFPQVTVIGDQTGGGGGAPVGWELPNGWFFNFSTSISYLPNGFFIEDGIPPDVKVDISEKDLAEGKDTILESALNYFR